MISKHSRANFRCVIALVLCLGLAAHARAADNLRLAPNLDFMKNKEQGAVIIGDNLNDGVVKGMPNYIFFYAQFCYNAKRQALRTIELYRDYGDRVHFVIVDLSRPVLRRTQLPIVKTYSGLSFPHTTILDKNGKVVFNYTGEVDVATLVGWLDTALRSGSNKDDAPRVAEKRGAGSPRREH